MPAYVIYREPDGREVRTLYVPPKFPVRDHRIDGPDGRSLIVTPGQVEVIKEKGKETIYRPRHFTFLKDALHATRFTGAEAAAFATKVAGAEIVKEGTDAN